MTDNNEPDKPETIFLPPSDEVSEEEIKRAQIDHSAQIKAEVDVANEAEAKRIEKMLKAQQEANDKAEIEHYERNRREHEERIEAAKAFDWDSWEKETGLTRPEIEG